MRLRGKLLLLLLALALLPLAVVRVVDARSLFKLRDVVIAQARSQLDAEIEQGLERSVASFSKRVEQEERLIRALLRVQADAVERRLRSISPPTAAGNGDEAGDIPPIFTLADFEQSPEAIPGLAPSDRHRRPADDGTLEPVPVSYDAQVLFALGPEDESVARSLQGLAGMEAEYGPIFELFPEAIFWQYTALMNGVYSSYPGKGGYPEDFNPLARPWFLIAMANAGRAREITEAAWAPPLPDAVTGRTILTATLPVYGADGQLAGVTAIDVPLDQLLERQRIDGAWGSDVEAMIVTAVSDQEARDRWGANLLDATGDQLAVFAGSDERRNPTRAGLTFRFSTLQLDAPTDTAEVFRAVREGRAGTLNTTLNGRPTKLAWGRLSNAYPSAVVIAAPLERLEATGAALQQQIEAETTKVFVASGLVVLGTVGLVLLSAWRGSRSVAQPVAELATAARSVADGDLDAHVHLKNHNRKDEIGDMARAFNDMVPKLRDRLHMRSALDLAMEVQQSLLPQHSPTLPGWEVAGRSDYCDETGGDYYDYLELTQPDAKHLGIALGDVTGHGIAAALLMCTGRALLRSRADTDGSLAELIGRVNDHLTAAGFTGRFMTLFYLALQAEPFELRYVSAGHDPAIVYDPDATDDAGRFSELAGSDLPLGIEPGWAFTEKTCDALPPRAVVVLGTDGIWEARNPADDMYGKDRLMQVVRTRTDAGDNADAIAQAILDDVHRFRDSREQLDDITLVVLRRVGADG